MNKKLNEIKNRNEYIECAKCHHNAHKPEYNRWDRSNEYKEGYAIRSQDGTIYCWDCYKSISHCQGCDKSTAKMKFLLDADFQQVSGYSEGCERIKNEVNFICSRECLTNIVEKKRQAWKEKLNQGWKKCPECVKFWIDEESNEEYGEWLKEEKYHHRFIKLLAPGTDKEMCDRCLPHAKGHYYHQIHQKAQKFWDSLSKEERRREMIRTDGVGMAKFYGEKLTVEQLTEQQKVPRSIYEDFVHNTKCCTCGEEPCHLEKKNKNGNLPNGTSALSVASKNSLIVAKKEELAKLKTTPQASVKRISELEQEIWQLELDQKNNLSKNSHHITGWVIGGILVSALLVGLTAVLKIKKRKIINNGTKS